MTGRRTTSCGEAMAIQLPESRVAAETVAVIGPLVGDHHQDNHNNLLRPSALLHRKTTSNNNNNNVKVDVAHVLLRLSCLLTSVTALSFMAVAKEDGTISVYGFQLPLHAKWSFSDSFEYLVGVSAAVIAHSVLQLFISLSRLLRRSPVIPSTSQAWLIFAVDQVFAYAMTSAGSAAAGVTNLNKTGVRHTVLPKFCNSLHSFCNRVAVSIAFALLSCFLLGASAILNVFWLSKN